MLVFWLFVDDFIVAAPHPLFSVVRLRKPQSRYEGHASVAPAGLLPLSEPPQTTSHSNVQ